LIAGVGSSRVLQLVDPTSHVSWSHTELFICSYRIVYVILTIFHIFSRFFLNNVLSRFIDIN